MCGYHAHVSTNDPAAVDELPKFENPPVSEVVIGVEFVPLPELTTVRLVQTHALWAEKYPKLVEQPPLPPTSQPDGVLAGIGLRFGAGVGPIRLWMLTDDEDSLLQLQNDRLTLNWRRISHTAAYPSYADLLPEFEARFQDFRQSLHEDGLQPTVAEMTYVNIIEDSTSSDLSNLCPIVGEYPGPGNLIRTGAQFVAAMEDMPGHTIVTFNAEDNPGRVGMTVVSRVALRTDLNLTQGDLRVALDYAHRCSVWSFTNLTAPRLHERWGRTT